MKKSKFLFILITIIAVVAVGLTACDNGEKDNVTVTLDGETLSVKAGESIEEPSVPKKDSTAQYDYVFDGWYIEGTDVKWDFATDKATENLSLVSVFTEVTRQYRVKIGDTDLGLKDYGTRLDVPEDPTKASDQYFDYIFLGWYKDEKYSEQWDFDNDVVIGETTIRAKFKGETRRFNVTINGAEPVTYKYLEKISRPADPEVPENLRGTHKFDCWINEATDRMWNFEKDYVASDIVLVPRFIELFTFEILSEEVVLGGNKYAAMSITDQDYASMTVVIKDSSGEEVELGAIRDGALRLDIARGDYSYEITFRGMVSQGQFSVGDVNEYKAYIAPDVKIGGYMGKTSAVYRYPSYGVNYAVDGDSISMWNITYAFAGDGTLVDKVYIEADELFPSNALGMMAGIMPACDYANLSGDAAYAYRGDTDKNKNKLVFSVSANKTLYSQMSEGWGSGTGIIAETQNVVSINTKYKLAVLRYEDNYYVFVDGKLQLVYNTDAFDKSGFGFCITTDFGKTGESNPITYSDVRYITDEEVLLRMKQEVVGSATVDYDAETISVTQSDTELVEGVAIPGVRTYLEFNAPSGKSMVGYEVSSDNGNVTVYEEDGKIWFVPTRDRVYSISARFIDEIDSAVTIEFKPYALLLGGKEYALHDFDIDPADIELSVFDYSSSETRSIKVEELTPVLSLKTGRYTFIAKYADNVTEVPVSVTENSGVVTIYLSDAYMGGKVSGNGYTASSYNNAAADATSGTSWNLKSGMRDTVSMTNYTFVYYRGLYASSYYAEAYFDTSLPDYNLNTTNKFSGIMIASRHVNLDGDGTGTDDKMKILVGIYGKSIVLTYTNGWSASNTITVANWSQIIDTLPEKVKLGVLRDGTDYYFFVNDTFVTKKNLSLITEDCGVGLASLNNKSVVYKFNASTDASLVSALKSMAIEGPKQIDIYIMAGQSNASGYTAFDNATMIAYDDSTVYGNNNVLYAGRAQYTGTNKTVGYNEYNWGLARVGQGWSNTKMSAEASMSAILASYYNASSGKVAGIIKFAHGGTALLNSLTGENAVGGNWVPKSYADIKGYEWSVGDPLTGRLYRNLLKQVEQRVEELRADGYTEINIKGVWWMQGEADKYSPDEYKVILEYFISDLRRDLGEITDEDLSELPFIIGEISRTSGNADISVSVNKKFIAMQNAYCESHDNVYISKIGDYDINKMVDGTSVAVGTDSWHWNQNDMIKIGEDAARIILEKILNVD